MSYYTYEEAIAAAANYGLEEEVKYLMDHGFAPDEALREWDCEPEQFEEVTKSVRESIEKNFNEALTDLVPPEFDGAGFTEEDNNI